VTVMMKTDAMTASFFDVFVDLKQNELNNQGRMRIGMRNWTTGRMIDLQEFPITRDYTTASLLGVPTGPYRRADGMIEVQLYAFNNNPVAIDPYIVFYDRLKVVAR
jgi:hypothetical protein